MYVHYSVLLLSCILLNSVADALPFFPLYETVERFFGKRATPGKPMVTQHHSFASSSESLTAQHELSSPISMNDRRRPSSLKLNADTTKTAASLKEPFVPGRFSSDEQYGEHLAKITDTQGSHVDNEESFLPSPYHTLHLPSAGRDYERLIENYDTAPASAPKAGDRRPLPFEEQLKSAVKRRVLANLEWLVPFFSSREFMVKFMLQRHLSPELTETVLPLRTVFDRFTMHALGPFDENFNLLERLYNLHLPATEKSRIVDIVTPIVIKIANTPSLLREVQDLIPSEETRQYLSEPTIISTLQREDRVRLLLDRVLTPFTSVELLWKVAIATEFFPILLVKEGSRMWQSLVNPKPVPVPEKPIQSIKNPKKWKSVDMEKVIPVVTAGSLATAASLAIIASVPDVPTSSNSTVTLQGSDLKTTTLNDAGLQSKVV